MTPREQYESVIEKLRKGKASASDIEFVRRTLLPNVELVEREERKRSKALADFRKKQEQEFAQLVKTLPVGEPRREAIRARNRKPKKRT